jgi:hypothetical protein
MFQFLFKYFSNTDTTATATDTTATDTTATSGSTREYPFNIHYRTAYKKCWIDKIKK